MSNTLQPHELQHTRLSDPSLSPWVYSNSGSLVSDATQPSHSLFPPSPPTIHLPQHQGLFQWVSSLHLVAPSFIHFIMFWVHHFNSRRSLPCDYCCRQIQSMVRAKVCQHFMYKSLYHILFSHSTGASSREILWNFKFFETLIIILRVDYVQRSHQDNHRVEWKLQNTVLWGKVIKNNLRPNYQKGKVQSPHKWNM